MDPWELSNMGKPSPRRELQLHGPRPNPLKVCKDSHKVRKPTAAAHGAGPSRTQQHPLPSRQQTRAPVIIYVLSPKVIHTDPSNFMEVVQRLTGPSLTTSPAAAAAAAEAPSLAVSSSGCSSIGTPDDLLCTSQLATVERSSGVSSVADEAMAAGTADNVDIMGLFGVGGAAAADRAGNVPGMTLPPLPQFDSLFSPPTVDPASLAFLNDISPVFQEGNRRFLEGLGNGLSNSAPSWDPLSQLW